MKVCVFCDSAVDDTVTTCPNCSSNRFKAKCPRCGHEYEGAACPQCSANDAEMLRAANAERAKHEAEKKANKGLVWKTALTVLMPYIGGYFLVRKEVRAGFRYFAMAWCLLMSLVFGTTQSALSTKLLGAVFSLGPIAVYLIREKAWLWKDTNSLTKALSIASVAVLVIAVTAAMAGGDNPKPKYKDTISSNASQPTQASSPTSQTTQSENESGSSASEADEEAQKEAKAKQEAEAKAKAKQEAEAKAKQEAEAEAEAKQEEEAKNAAAEKAKQEKEAEAASKQKAEPSKYEYAYVRHLNNYDLYYLIDLDAMTVTSFGTNDSGSMVLPCTGDLDSGLTVDYVDYGFQEHLQYETPGSDSALTLIDANGFDWEYTKTDVAKAESVLDSVS